MRDPHVVSLKYRMELAKDESYNNPPPIEGDHTSFSFCLHDEVLDVKMKVHFATANEARRQVDPFLRAWELHHALQAGRNRIRFVFTNAEVIDRNPRKPGEPQVVELSGAAVVSISTSGTLSACLGRYPEPSSDLLVSPDVETMWGRYQMYLDGKEPLLSMAYFCLTVMEGTTAGPNPRKSVCTTYGKIGRAHV